MTNSPYIRIPDNCAAEVASAIERLHDRWGPYSIESTACSLYSLFGEVIIPAITAYLSALPPNHLYRWILPNLSFAKLVRLGGFSLVGEVVHACLLRYISLARLLRPERYDSQFEETLEALREVARACAAKVPKTTQSDKRRANVEYCRIRGVDTDGVSRPKNAKKSSAGSSGFHAEYCEFCGALTEVATRNKGLTERSCKNNKARLSGKYCINHRAKLDDDLWNNQHQSAQRTKSEFETEVTRLSWQAVSMSKPNSGTGDPYLDLFYFNAIGHLAVFPSDSALIRNEARRIVDLNISDKRKRIIAMRTAGYSLAEIAIEVGANSRQAVAKSLALTPSKYRFDLPTHEPSDRNIDNPGPYVGKNARPKPVPVQYARFLALLGNAAAKALENSDVIELLANDDGLVWSDSRIEKMRQIAVLTTSEAEHIIRFANQNFVHEPCSTDELIAVFLPAGNARFTGSLPPFVDKPSFAIRKEVSPKAWLVTISPAPRKGSKGPAPR
jgi:hypothetical protein